MKRTFEITTLAAIFLGVSRVIAHYAGEWAAAGFLLFLLASLVWNSQNPDKGGSDY